MGLTDTFFRFIYKSRLYCFIIIFIFIILMLSVVGIRWYLKKNITIDIQDGVFENKIIYDCFQNQEKVGYLVLDTNGTFYWSYKSTEPYLLISGKYESNNAGTFLSVILYPKEDTIKNYLKNMPTIYLKSIDPDYDQLQLIMRADTYIFYKIHYDSQLSNYDINDIYIQFNESSVFNKSDKIIEIKLVNGNEVEVYSGNIDSGTHIETIYYFIKSGNRWLMDNSRVGIKCVDYY